MVVLLVVEIARGVSNTHKTIRKVFSRFLTDVKKVVQEGKVLCGCMNGKAIPCYATFSFFIFIFMGSQLCVPVFLFTKHIVSDASWCVKPKLSVIGVYKHSQKFTCITSK